MPADALTTVDASRRKMLATVVNVTPAIAIGDTFNPRLTLLDQDKETSQLRQSQLRPNATKLLPVIPLAPLSRTMHQSKTQPSTVAFAPSGLTASRSADPTPRPLTERPTPTALEIKIPTSSVSVATVDAEVPADTPAAQATVTSAVTPMMP
jgi:hypothetical protein